jgi:Protein of unknown function (DUF1553)/Protein of unknown function (DUF1549)/Planctomycete cytochrome C/F5/8 type C domain
VEYGLNITRAIYTMQKTTPRHLLISCAAIVALGLGTARSSYAAEPPGAKAEFFETKVRPLLVKNCLGCHSGSDARGGLALNSAEGLKKGGTAGAAIDPTNPKQSLIYRAVHHVPGTASMPPGARLSEAELSVMDRWLNMGAPFPASVSSTSVPTHKPSWAMKPLALPSVPRIPGDTWSKTDIDRFILARLKRSGLKPSAAADKRTILRRAVYDLTGLPPTPEQVQEYLSDTKPDAYARLIDRLLASKAYGERWGRHWLDIVHYGDTHGYDKDKRRDHAWPYRDYVIGAFNSDMPYEKFIKQQIAGDVLYPSDPSATIATGLLAAGPWDFVGNVELAEGTVEKEKTRLIDRDDMVATVISTFDSVTIHCARCHDHKFDPIPQKDYYRLQAVFAGVERGDRAYYDHEHMVMGEKLRARRAELERKRDALNDIIRSKKSPEITAMEDAIQEAANGINAITLPAVPAVASPTNGFHSDISSVQNVTRWVQVDLGADVPIQGIRILPARPTDFADTPGFGFPVRYKLSVSDTPDFKTEAIIKDATPNDVPSPGDSPVVIVPASPVIARYVRITAVKLWKRTGDFVFALAEMQVISGSGNAAAGKPVTADHSIEVGRWANRYLTDGFDSRQSLLDLNKGSLGALQLQRDVLAARRAELRAARLARLEAIAPPDVKAERDQTVSALKEIDAQIASLPPAQLVYAALPRTPRPIWLLKRGDVEQKGDIVTPGALSCMPTEPANLGAAEEEGRARAGLAAWIASPKNTLTWRSIVNRVWQYHFTRGIVDTPNDFGNNGASPTHPELLDWLANWFLAHGQSIKALHKLIMTSAVYQQSSDTAPGSAGVTADADNRLLWRMNRRRLEAEEIRDSILCVSGTLNRKMGGPGFEPFRFKDDHSPIYDYGAVEKETDPSVFRRTVYEFIVRSVPDPFLETLDAADPNALTPVRNTTLTPLQALTMRNDPFVIRQSERFAERLRKERPEMLAQIHRACELIYSRRASKPEAEALMVYARRNGLANMCRILFNTNEFVFIE